MGSGVFDIGRRLFKSVTSPFLGSGVTLDILRQAGVPICYVPICYS